MTRAVAVIPARYASSRFPGKPLALIDGLPMVVRVLRNAAQARSIERVLVATDDERIADAVRADGGEPVMTAPELPSGTDRVWAAVGPIPADIVVNVQGDEPLLPGAVIDTLVDRLAADAEADIATPVTACSRAAALALDVVTVAVDESGRAWYFSRSVIPWGADPVWRHIGVYAYRKDALQRFVASPPVALERAERLEQLRALSLGLRIAAIGVDAPCQSVDRPGDVVAAERLLSQAQQSVDVSAVRLLVLDVDGVLTDGSIAYEGDAEQLMRFDVKDGYGIAALIQAGVQVAILSARDSAAVRRRAAELGIAEVAVGVRDKETELRRLTDRLGVPLDQVCYVGDDEPDLAPMALAGLSAAPSDASPAVLARATIRLASPGGKGAVREIADLIRGLAAAP